MVPDAMVKLNHRLKSFESPYSYANSRLSSLHLELFAFVCQQFDHISSEYRYYRLISNQSNCLQLNCRNSFAKIPFQYQKNLNLNDAIKQNPFFVLSANFPRRLVTNIISMPAVSFLLSIKQSPCLPWQFSYTVCISITSSFSKCVDNIVSFFCLQLFAR